MTRRATEAALATYWAAFIIFITPMNWKPLISLSGFAFVVLNIIGVFASLLFLSLFLAWTWPRTEPSRQEAIGCSVYCSFTFPFR